jgi:hypothetical protein
MERELLAQAMKKQQKQKTGLSTSTQGTELMQQINHGGNKAAVLVPVNSVLTSLQLKGGCDSDNVLCARECVIRGTHVNCF